jgi:hypothetical protein
MKKLLSVSAVFLTSALLAGAPAYAQNNGNMDDVWLSARIKTSLPRAANWSSWPDGPFELVKNVPVDTGKDSCFIHLAWDGVDSYSYTWATYCLNGNAQWEKDDEGSLYETTGSEVLYSDWADIQFAQAGKFVSGYPVDYAFAEYDGAFMLTPKTNKNGVVTSVSFANKGLVYSYDDKTGIGGTSRSGGLTIKLAKDVPAGALACAAGGAAPLCP